MFKGLIPLNIWRNFDEPQIAKLGIYIYALRDPRDGKIFYVGQGTNGRLFDHFREAEDILKKGKEPSSKILRILDIWKNEEDVEWVILAHNLEGKAVNFVESAVHDALKESTNGALLNDYTPPSSSLLTKEAVLALCATQVNPNKPYDFVFLFPIQNALADGKNEYEATRGNWYVKKEYRNKNGFAVGLNKGFSRGSFKITGWIPTEDEKFKFEGKQYSPLENKHWNKILQRAAGYWKRGNYLIVKFDGKGKASIIRGAGEAKDWFAIE
jgi:hypothetical protein